VAQAPNDKQQLEPMLAKTGALPKELGQAETMLADNGYFSEANVKACPAAGVEPLIALGGDAHHQSLRERFADAPPPENPTPVEAMAHRLKTPAGKKLYAKRKHTPEPVFGIIKSVPPVSAARTGEGQSRVDAGHLGLEYEADVRPKDRLRTPARRSAPLQINGDGGSASKNHKGRSDRLLAARLLLMRLCQSKFKDGAVSQSQR
jgi:hypothetical protein